MDNQPRIAVLIDAENVSSKYAKLIMDEVSDYGVATYKRIYGDFTTTSVKPWINKLQEYAITPVLQYNYTHGKNASDFALTIDAMDILYSEKVNGFCLVTSDSDFTKLATRLREAGMLVIGMGERKTPNALVSACETFKFLDLLYEEGTPKAADKVLENPESEEEPCEEMSSIPNREEIEMEITSIIESKTGDEEWVNLSEIGISLSKRVPGFDPRNYKCKKLRELIESSDTFVTKAVANPHNKLLKIIFVKVKD